MSHVLILGATGRAGAAVLTRLPAATRITAALRVAGDQERLPLKGSPVRPVVVDLDDPNSLRAAADGADTVVNAIRLRDDIAPTALIDLHHRIRYGTAATDPLIVTVGGAGALRLPDGTRFWQHPAFPTVTVPRGRAHAALRDHLDSGDAGSRWSYLMPPPAFDPDGPALCAYTTWPPGEQEEAHCHRAISYIDYAAAVADAATQQWTGTRLVAAR